MRHKGIGNTNCPTDAKLVDTNTIRCRNTTCLSQRQLIASNMSCSLVEKHNRQLRDPMTAAERSASGEQVATDRTYSIAAEPLYYVREDRT